MRSPHSTDAVGQRYGWVAAIYDWANLEGLLYTDARRRAVELLDPRPGARVLDAACGTGANFDLVEQRIGPAGELVGLDLTPQMLGRAHARVAREGWGNVRLHEGDICDLDVERLGATGAKA
jgi:demethylmenaquinone methyltransferase/2-methoxy-6-polyprenyl-1,4-benzoquinol methylase